MFQVTIDGIYNQSERLMPYNVFNVIDFKEESDGLVAIQFRVGDKFFWTYVNLWGKRATKERFLNASRFIRGKALVLSEDYFFKIIDTRFRVLSERSAWKYNPYNDRVIKEYDLGGINR